ncbi:MAG TPA: flagellar export protein FliJ [Smithellaceae bacterium]|nr:flagellar export protein FliJ [Smithellaceae bacterium]
MFVFRFQTVLDFRKNVEEKILGEFSEKKRQLEFEELKLQNLMKEWSALLGELKKMQNKAVPVGDIARYVAYIDQVKENENRQKIKIAEVSGQLETKRIELLDAVRKTKIMEKLKQRHAKEYKDEERALEQKNSDEMSVLKFGRR